MRLDAALPQVSLAEVPPIAAAAEEIGLAALWASETRHDPFLPCTLVAEHTARLRLGTAIAVSFARSPENLAQAAWDLAAQSSGRFILGLGTQVRAHVERRFGMTWPESVTGRLREQIAAIRAFWDCWQNGTKLNFRGEHYKLTLMSPFFNPGPIQHPNIPIFIAGVNVGLASLAGELCDGFVVHPFHSRRYLEEVILPAMRVGCGRSGRTAASLEVFVTAFVATNGEEREFARSQLAFYASTPSYKSVMELHGWAGVAAQLSYHAARAEWDRMPALISDEVLAEFCLLTNEDRLADDLLERYEGIATRLALYDPFVPGRNDQRWQRLAAAFNEGK